MKINRKMGISLMALIITIIVIIILAGAIILSLSSNNPIKQAKKAVFVGDVGNFKSELSLYENKQYLDKLGDYNPRLLHADGVSVTYNGIVDAGVTINDLIPTLGKSNKYDGQFQVIDGELIFQGSDTDKQEWAKEIGTEVIIVGEPQITILPPSETLVIPGMDIIYSIKFSSNAPLTTIDLTNKVEILDNTGLPIKIQPVINISAISGTSADVIRYTEITIKTDILVSGEYKLRIKSGSVINSEGNFNSQDTISLIGFEVLDDIPPENPSMSASPSGWTNTDVAVTITYSKDSLVKEYSLDGTNWNNYTEAIVITENNVTVYAKATDASGNQTTQATLTVSNIDKTLPTLTTTSGSVTTSSITIIAIASDTGGSELNASSYQYSKDNGTTWTTATTATNYTFSGITTGTYQCKIKVSDNAGNITISEAISMTTTGLGTIGISATPTGWTNGNVTVTITYPAEIVTKQYSTDTTTWNTYTSPVVVSTNGTTVYAKGLDAGGNQTTQATLTVSNIDKNLPTLTATSGSVTSSSITVTAIASDTGGSGLNAASYQYSKDNGTTWTTATTATSYTFSGITTGTYQCKVKVSDNAGNSAISSAVAITTTPLGTVTLAASPTGWTNGNVTVTITYPSSVVTKQYSIDGTTWNTYTSQVVVSTNGTTVYAKGLDVAGNQTTQASLTVANIDKIKPVITLVGSNPIGITVGSAYVDEGAVASDNVNGNLTASIQVTSNVNTSVKGSYSVTYNVTDSSGNAATPVVRTVTVIDQVSSYNYTAGNQTFIVPVTGTYIISAVGAAGGYTGYNTIGKGALVEGTFALIQGQVISIVAGGKGGDGSWPAGGGRRRWNIHI